MKNKLIAVDDDLNMLESGRDTRISYLNPSLEFLNMYLNPTQHWISVSDFAM